MQSPYKRIVVYDLETGGLNENINSITEIALVAIDLETLEIVDKTSVLIKPRIDLSFMSSDYKLEAKNLYKQLAVKNEDLGIKTMLFKDENITLKNLDLLIDPIKEFHKFISKNFKSGIIQTNDIKDILDFDIGELYVNNAYNPQAEDVTKISKKLLYEEGVDFVDAFNVFKQFLEKHTIGNSKPIISGHNIKKFDNPFSEKFFKDNKSDFYKLISPLCIDTIEWARLRWYNLSNFSLGTCANEVGLTLKTAHRALPDTISNAKFLIKMLESLRGFGGVEQKKERRKYNFNY